MMKIFLSSSTSQTRCGCGENCNAMKIEGAHRSAQKKHVFSLMKAVDLIKSRLDNLWRKSATRETSQGNGTPKNTQTSWGQDILPKQITQIMKKVYRKWTDYFERVGKWEADMENYLEIKRGFWLIPI